MTNTFFISDHHFQHSGVLKFKDAHHCLIRPEFDSVDEMNEYMIESHNKTVGVNDTVYFLGDVTWKTNTQSREIMSRLNGKKYLCVGNHDDVNFLYPYFKKVYLWKYFPEFNMIASHVPLAKRDLKRAGYNVHGHTHEQFVKRVVAGVTQEDWRYANVCVENIGYIPIELEELRECLNDFKKD